MSRLRFALLTALVVSVGPVIAIAQAVPAKPVAGAKAAPAPYPQHVSQYEAVRDLLSGKGDQKQVVAAIDRALSEILLPAPPAPAGAPAKPAAKVNEKDQNKQLASLLTLRSAATTFAKAQNTEMAQYLLDRPRMCARFLHAVDAKDNLDKALTVLGQLRDFDPKRFERWSEFCIAFSVVWDNFEGHWWARKTVPREDDLMLATYKHYCDNERMLLIDPAQMPFELGVYVVGTRLRATERQWIVQNYNPRMVEPGSLYKSVPWTKKLSPAHGTGAGIDYTLSNIKQHGGVCMEQAYFSENVCRMFGVPAVYTHGRGERGGHAWVGTLLLRPRPHWDFSFGRYEYDHYFKGEVDDPTQPGKEIPDSIVAMTGAMLTAGSIDKIEEGYALCEAAKWLGEHGAAVGEDDGAKKRLADAEQALLVRSLKASPYCTQTWLFIAEQAKAGSMDNKTAQYWADQMFQLTVNDYPDFTIDCLQRFFAAIEKPQDKAKILAKLYTIISRIRPDLAADVKVAEGDIWLEQGNVDSAMESYMFPLVHFSKDKHILETAEKRLDALADKADAKKLEAAYLSVLSQIQRANQKDEAIAGIRKTVAQKLTDLYTKQGETAKAGKLKDLL